MAEVKVSAGNRIVIPREAREALRVRAGDKLLVVVRGRTVVLLAKPESHNEAIRGIGCGGYPPVYMEQERQSWE